MSTYDPIVQRLITRHARRYGIDPAAALAVASVEGGIRYGAVGDAGTSHGPFQLRVGGANPYTGARASSFANSPAGIDYAIRKMAEVGARGKTGRAAIEAIVRQFERPKAPDAEIQRALAQYQPGAVGSMGAKTTMASTAPGRPRPNTAATLKTLMANTNAILRGGTPDYSNYITVLSGPPVKPGARPKAVPVVVDHNGPIAPQVKSAVDLARQYLGTPYVWGGAKPGGFDCSGLLQFVWGKLGVSIPRVSQQQWRAGRSVTHEDLQPGDAVFFHMKSGGPGHVGMFIGHDNFLHAPHTGDVVKISKLSTYRGFVGARRFV